MSQQRLPPDFDAEEDQTPAGFKTLFPEDPTADLTKITETPAKMILPLVRLRIITASFDTKRKESLLDIFVREFDHRMISKDRLGRIEAVRMLQGSLMGEGEEEEASM